MFGIDFDGQMKVVAQDTKGNELYKVHCAIILDNVKHFFFFGVAKQKLPADSSRHNVVVSHIPFHFEATTTWHVFLLSKGDYMKVETKWRNSAHNTSSAKIYYHSTTWNYNRKIRLSPEFSPFDYFEELEQRIQDIRTSERRFYQKITDIYATSIDYDPTLDISIEFFKTVQNKMHWAITGKTAAEIIHSRADAAKPNMGLTSYRHAKVRKQDVTIAKNYLKEDELAALNNLVEQYLIFAQGQAMRRIPMYMKDWIKKLDGFLKINDREILENAGKISHEIAKQLAEGEYKKFHSNRLSSSTKELSDFDKAVKQIESSKKKGSK